MTGRRIAAPVAPLRGACADLGLDLFFAEHGGSVARAKAICRDCPVRAACLDGAMRRNEQFGVWGGLSVNERRALRKKAG